MLNESKKPFAAIFVLKNTWILHVNATLLACLCSMPEKIQRTSITATYRLYMRLSSTISYSGRSERGERHASLISERELFVTSGSSVQEVTCKVKV